MNTSPILTTRFLVYLVLLCCAYYLFMDAAKQELRADRATRAGRSARAGEPAPGTPIFVFVPEPEGEPS